MLKLKRKKAKKGTETLQRHRIGNYELRISETKCEVEDVVHKLTKHVYYVGGYEYGLFAYLLSTVKKDGDNMVAKTTSELEESFKIVEFIVYMLAYTNLIFSNVNFRGQYFELIQKFVSEVSPSEISNEESDEILAEMQTAQQMQESLLEE